MLPISTGCLFEASLSVVSTPAHGVKMHYKSRKCLLLQKAETAKSVSQAKTKTAFFYDVLAFNWLTLLIDWQLYAVLGSLQVNADLVVR